MGGKARGLPIEILKNLQYSCLSTKSNQRCLKGLTEAEIFALYQKKKGTPHLVGSQINTQRTGFFHSKRPKELGFGLFKKILTQDHSPMTKMSF